MTIMPHTAALLVHAMHMWSFAFKSLDLLSVRMCASTAMLRYRVMSWPACPLSVHASICIACACTAPTGRDGPPSRAGLGACPHHDYPSITRLGRSLMSAYFTTSTICIRLPLAPRGPVREGERGAAAACRISLLVFALKKKAYARSPSPRLHLENMVRAQPSHSVFTTAITLPSLLSTILSNPAFRAPLPPAHATLILTAILYTLQTSPPPSWSRCPLFHNHSHARVVPAAEGDFRDQAFPRDRTPQGRGKTHPYPSLSRMLPRFRALARSMQRMQCVVWWNREFAAGTTAWVACRCVSV